MAIIKKTVTMVAIALLAVAIALVGTGCESDAVKADKDTIGADVAKVFGSTITADEIKKELLNDEIVSEYVRMGFDADAYAENMAKLYKVELKDIKVDNDKADVVLVLTCPVFNDEAEKRINDELSKAGVPDNETPEEAKENLQAYIDAATKVLTEPDFPVTSGECTVKYVKADGVWKVEDPDEAQKQVSTKMAELANVNK